MNSNRFLDAHAVAKELNVSQSTAYKIIRSFNQELEAKGFHTRSGRVERDYFEDKFYSNSKSK